MRQVVAEVTRSGAYQPYTHSEEDIGTMGEALHVTRYLHSNGRFRKLLPRVRAMIIALARAVDAVEGWKLLRLRGRGAGSSHTSQIFPEAACSRPVVRCAEVHEMVRGGRLPYWDHYDVGSLITVDVMLEEPEAGGEFQTPETDGSTTSHEFRRGDALVFPSAKYHRVEPVRRGFRRTLVVEIWSGREVTEDHRCETRRGPCKCPAGGGAGFDLDGVWRESLSD